MVEFIGEQIEVERDEKSPQPVSFTWRGRIHVVAEVLEERVDTGFGGAPPRSRRWYNRRHRRHFVVKDSSGNIFEIYLDYANRRDQTWWLVRR
jgi:hypothetical protein